MIGGSVRVFLAVGPVDLRGAFDQLAAVTRQVLGEDPKSGALHLFYNRRRNRLKALWWDRNGYTLLYKAVLIHTPELAETQTQLGAAHHRLVLGLVSRVVGVTQHASSLQLSQHARLYATGHLRDLALGGSPGLGKDGSVAVVVVHAVEHE